MATRDTSRTRRLLGAAGVTALVALGGCMGHTAPKATVTDARLTERSDEAAVVEFTIETTNPNDFELPMREIMYSMSLDGARVFHGERAAAATIPRNGTQTLTVPVVVPLGEEGVELGTHRYTLSGTIRYSLPSQLADVLFDSNISRPSMSVRERGEIDLQ